MRGTPRLVAAILYGGGLRLLEALRLRIKDVDFVARLLVVREGKGGKDRRTMLPDSLQQPLHAQIELVRRIHRKDLAAGAERSSCPTPWSESTRTRRASSGGNICFRRRVRP